MPLTINGERLECVESVEWVRAPVPVKPKITFPTIYEIKMDLDPETSKRLAEDIAAMFKPEWFVIEMQGVIIGRIRNIEWLDHDELSTYHQVKAEFEPADALKEMCGGNESAMELNAVVFQFDDAGVCRGIHFVKEE